MAENDRGIYDGFVELLIFGSEEMPNNKVIKVFKDTKGFLYLAPLVRTEGLETLFFSIEEIEKYLGMKLTLLDIIPNPSKNKLICD
jgi:hypothetical protein